MREAQQKGEGGEVVERVQVPQDITFRLGCDRADAPCGVFTFLDSDADAPEQFEAILIDPVEGWTILESVPSLWEHLRLGDQPPGDKCGVVYNSAFHGAIPFDEEGVDGVESFGEGAVEDKSWIIPIVLDGDAQFYALNPATAWARQRSMLAQVNLMYHVIEPLSSGAFDILFALKGQEAWVTPGTGPTTTNKVDLTDEINDPDYPMITHPANNEVSYYFVGYDMDTGIAGRAGGICNVDGYDITFGSDEAHQSNHAWGQMVTDVDGGFAFNTAFGRAVVMAHEIGHMLGGTHGDGEANDCAGGGLPNLCGTSLLLGGGGGAPDFRQPYFTDANDANIVACVGDAVP